MDNVRFYQTADPTCGAEPFCMNQKAVTQMLGTAYQGVAGCVYMGGCSC